MSENLNIDIGDKYEIVRLLGEGGMGAVYLGRHKLIKKLVAVKILSHVLAKNEQYVKRFYREATAAAAIHHPNVVDVLDIGVTPEGQPFIVMEYLEGEGLDTILSRAAPLDLATAAAVIEPTLLALEQAHKSGIVHRDLKPENIFVVSKASAGASTVKLIDFGISKVLHHDNATQLTQDGSVLGTPAYMSPEQVSSSHSLDHRSDIFSVGVILYEMLAGQRPFSGGTSFDLMLSVMSDPLPDPFSFNPDFPSEALPIVEKALAKDRDQRFQSAEEMRVALEGCCDESDVRERLDTLADTLGTKVAMGDLGGSLTEELTSQSAMEIMTGLMTGGNNRKRGFRAFLKRAVVTAVFFLLFAALAAALGYIYFGRQLERGIAAAVEQGAEDGFPSTVATNAGENRELHPVDYEITSKSPVDSNESATEVAVCEPNAPNCVPDQGPTLGETSESLEDQGEARGEEQGEAQGEEQGEDQGEDQGEELGAERSAADLEDSSAEEPAEIEDEEEVELSDEEDPSPAEEEELDHLAQAEEGNGHSNAQADEENRGEVRKKNKVQKKRPTTKKAQQGKKAQRGGKSAVKQRKKGPAKKRQAVKKKGKRRGDGKKKPRRGKKGKKRRH